MNDDEFVDRNVVPLTAVDEAPFSEFSIRCPGCGYTICQITTPELTGFEAVCVECDTPLFPLNTVAVAYLLYEWTTDNEPLEAGKRRCESLTTEDYERIITADWDSRIGESDIGRGDCEHYAKCFGWEWPAGDNKMTNNCIVCDEPTTEPIVITTPGDEPRRYVCGPDHHIDFVRMHGRPGPGGSSIGKTVNCAICDAMFSQPVSVRYPGSTRWFHACSTICHLELARGALP